jgi:phage gp46-like protein
MTDIRLVESRSPLIAVTMDWLLKDDGLIDESEELATSVRVALGTDALADTDEILPDPDSTDRRGWWGDWEADIWEGWPIGCKCWLLSRSKIVDASAKEGSTLERARNYVTAAIQPFVDRGVISGFTVDVSVRIPDWIEVSAVLYRGPLSDIQLRYQLLWQEMS